MKLWRCDFFDLTNSDEVDDDIISICRHDNEDSVEEVINISDTEEEEEEEEDIIAVFDVVDILWITSTIKFGTSSSKLSSSWSRPIWSSYLLTISVKPSGYGRLITHLLFEDFLYSKAP